MTEFLEPPQCQQRDQIAHMKAVARGIESAVERDGFLVIQAGRVPDRDSSTRLDRGISSIG
jgi:hypothetical protein